jgi:hypothetical protein
LKIKFHLLSNYVVLIYWFHALILPPTTDRQPVGNAASSIVDIE